MATVTAGNPLTQEQINVIKTQGDAIANSGGQAVSGNTFVFWAGFDGTYNTADNPSYSNDPQSTAVGALFYQIEGGSRENDNVQAFYYPGVGTPGTNPGSGVNPTGQVIITAERKQRDTSRIYAYGYSGNIHFSSSIFLDK